MIRQILAGFLIAMLVVPAVGQTCQGGKCMSPAKRGAMKRDAMKKRLATPLVQTPAIQKINQQIIILAQTNLGGRNNSRIKGLQNQRNQMLKASRR